MDIPENVTVLWILAAVILSVLGIVGVIVRSILLANEKKAEAQHARQEKLDEAQRARQAKLDEASEARAQRREDRAEKREQAEQERQEKYIETIVKMTATMAVLASRMQAHDARMQEEHQAIINECKFSRRGIGEQ